MLKLKVLCVIPQGSKQTSFVFSRRQVECVGQQGVDVETFFCIRGRIPEQSLENGAACEKSCGLSRLTLYMPIMER
jgi:hypothetical protein